MQIILRLIRFTPLLLLFHCASAPAPTLITADQPSDSRSLQAISATLPYEKKYREIFGKQMAYVDEGEGDPIVFLHGNPTSSYLWRNIMPHLEGRGRLIAPDMIGMGDSEKLDNSGPDRYTFVEHREYLFALLDELSVKEEVTLIVHDWGSALGFHWAAQNPNAVKAIVFMEAIVAPAPGWEVFSEGGRKLFQGFRSDAGEEMVLQNNIFVEQVLPSGILRNLSDLEMNEYRRPYLTPGEDRRPTLTWPRQIPIAGEPPDVTKIVEHYGAYLAASPTPKLFINAEPGAILSGGGRALVRSWPNLTEVTVQGIHFVQEDAPHEIGRAISEWLPE